MQSFNLKIITSNGVKFEGEAQGVLVRTVAGDVSIWANHIDYVTALGIGRAQITLEGKKRLAACNSGVLSVLKGEVTILATTFEWQEEIDLARAQASLDKAKANLATLTDPKQIELEKLKVKRALSRIEIQKM